VQDEQVPAVIQIFYVVAVYTDIVNTT